MRLTVEWQEFIPLIRVNLLRHLLQIKILYDGEDITVPDYLSSGEMEAVKFICNPTHPINFAILDKNFGLKLLQIHNEFWNFYYSEHNKVTKFNNEYYCLGCLEELTYECQICETRFLKEDIIYGPDDEICCSEECADSCKGAEE